MTRLPVEVLHVIFLQLSTRDKLECMTVCRQWEQVITHSLFRVVYIRSQEQLNKLIGRIKRDPTLGAQVERLILKLESENDFDEKVLVDLTPNVREFTLVTDDYFDTSDSEIENSEPIRKAYETHKNHPWCDRIERIVEDAPAIYTRALLRSTSCRNLTHMSLTGRSSPSISELIASLDKTPALKMLELRAYRMSLRDFELLHYLVPTLASITMRWCYVDCIAFPNNIEPATSVKSFQSVECSASCMRGFPFIKYILEKYTNLEEIGFKSYDLGLMEEEETELAAETRAMMVSYLKKLSTGLKTLSLHLDACYNVLPGFDFDVLDESDCHIQNLKLDSIRSASLFQQLANTTQVKYIQSLTVHQFPYNDNNRNGSIVLKWLSNFTSLKELALAFHSTGNCYIKLQLNLADLLDIVAEAQVETLRLADMELSFNTSGATRTYPLIKDLTLDGVDFKYNTDIAISRSLINLRRLKLANCAQYKISFTFPMTQLSYLEVSEWYSSEPLHLLVMTIDNNQQRLYTVKYGVNVHQPEWDGIQGDPISLTSTSTQPYNGSIDGRILSVVCQSVYNCFVIKKY